MKERGLKKCKEKVKNTDGHHHYLDFANFISLELWSAVVVDEADATC